MGRYALLVATSDYADPDLKRLRAPAADAEQLAELLRNPEIGRFDDVRVLHNEPKSTVEETIEELFGARKRDDLILLYLSCHGVKDEAGRLFFATARSKLRMPHSTAVSAAFVAEQLGRSRAGAKIALLDCCFSGAFARGFDARASASGELGKQIEGRGTYVMTASDTLEYAYEGKDLLELSTEHRSVFTGAVIDGLRTGAADLDGDGIITADELFSYVEDRVASVAVPQHPTSFASGVRGAIPIAYTEPARQPRAGLDPSLPALHRLLGWSDPSAFDSTLSWGRPLCRFLTPIGMGADGDLIELDLGDSERDGGCLHGMVVGGPGSGYPELVRTVVLGLAATYSPAVLNFVLVDVNGRAIFAGLDRLPHTAAVLTDLRGDLSSAGRLANALSGELSGRQALARPGDAKLRPALLVVIDGISDLLALDRTFLDLLARLADTGGTVGLCLLVSAESLKEDTFGSVADQFSYRIGLRMSSPQESARVLGVRAAYELPPKAGYLKMPKAELIRFVIAQASGQDEIAMIDALAASAEPSIKASQFLLPLMDEAPSLGELLPNLKVTEEFGLTTVDPPAKGRLCVILGIVDIPAEKRREPLCLDLAGEAGNLAIVGGPWSGKGYLLCTLVCSLALTHTPADVQFYCIDAGAGRLKGLADLPHVGCVASWSDDRLVRRIVADLREIMRRRERVFADHQITSMAAYRSLRHAATVKDPYGDVFLVVDGWSLLCRRTDGMAEDLADLAARGLRYGVHLVVAVERWVAILPAPPDAFKSRLELRLTDPNESLVDEQAAAFVPLDSPGRGIVAPGLHFFTALPRVDGSRQTRDLDYALHRLTWDVAAAWRGAHAPPVRSRLGIGGMRYFRRPR